MATDTVTGKTHSIYFDYVYRVSFRACYLMDYSLCYETSNEVAGECAVPKAYGFSFGQLIGNCSIPEGGRPFYRFIVSSEHDFKVELKDLKIVSAGPDVETVDKSFFE